jgi:hypothetical protein
MRFHYRDNDRDTAWLKFVGNNVDNRRGDELRGVKQRMSDVLEVIEDMSVTTVQFDQQMLS